MLGTSRRLVGAFLFVPIIVLVAVSQSAAQWLLMALAALMVLEFSAMLALPMALRAALLMDFVLFALPAPIFAGIEAAAGMPLDLVILALAALVIGLIWAMTRNGLASILSRWSSPAFSPRAGCLALKVAILFYSYWLQQWRVATLQPISWAGELAGQSLRHPLAPTRPDLVRSAAR